MNKPFLLLLCGLLTLSSDYSAQNSYDQEWHFGNGISVEFGTGSPIVGTSSVITNSNVEPASVCNNIGALMAYMDGDTLFNASGQAVVNGGFENTAQENIFSAIPGSPFRFFLFRSSEDFGVSWSIVDLQAADGQGEILEAEKQQIFHPHFSQLMVTSHADMVNFWLVVADNNSGEGSLLQMTSFTIASDGIEEISEFSGSYLFATWYDQLEEARMSPSCEKIATSHKGHYVTMFEFDNSTGIISTGFDQSASLPDSFSPDNLNYIDFSPSGDFLYVIRDNTTVIRFDASLLEPMAFLMSEEDLGFQGLEYTHIKRGPNGKMYLLDQNDQMLDVIEDADEAVPILIEDEVALGANARFFPNTMNSCQSFAAIQVSDACIGDSTYFVSNIGAEADSVYWVISGNMVQDTVYDLLSFIEFYPNVGDYDITFNFLFDTLWTSLAESSTIFAQPVIELGNDIVACQGEVVQLSAGEQPFPLTWSTAETTPTIDVEIGGLYSVQIINGLCAAIDDIAVEFIQVPFSYIEDIVICDSIYPITLDASGEHIDTYQWQDGPSAPTQIVDTTGVYPITLSNSCFEIEDSASVTFVLFPDDLLDDEYSICGTDTLFLSSIYPYGDITWSNGDVGEFAQIVTQGFFTLEIEHFGCFISDEFFVDRLDYIDVNLLEMPNVATFNGDSFNDEFRPFIPWEPQTKICDYRTLTVEQKIYNRWGNLLEEGDCSWDGESATGTLVPEGTYYYIVDLFSKCLENESEKRIADHFQVLK
jgi:hypothetical protein